MMTDPSAHAAQRLDALEMQVAHQERLIVELNDVITAQWRKLDALERHIARLREEADTAAPTRDGPEPPPPHY